MTEWLNNNNEVLERHWFRQLTCFGWLLYTSLYTNLWICKIKFLGPSQYYMSMIQLTFHYKPTSLNWKKKKKCANSLAVQWLGLHAFTAGATGSILGQGTKIPHAKRQPKKKKISDFDFKSILVTQSCLTLCNAMDYTVCGILQARILEWVAFPFSRGSSQPRDQTQVSHIACGCFTSWAIREAH